MATYNITLNDGHLSCDTNIKLMQNSAWVDSLNFIFRDDFAYNYFRVDFEKPDGTKYISPLLEIENGECLLNIETAITDTVGKGKLQITYAEGETIYKTALIEYEVIESINATEDIPESNPLWIEQINETLVSINGALENVKNFIIDIQRRVNNGEFNGRPGTPGLAGYTPVKGVDYFDGEDGKDGITPVKGVDYFDGEDGKDGITPTPTLLWNDGGWGSGSITVNNFSNYTEFLILFDGNSTKFKAIANGGYLRGGVRYPINSGANEYGLSFAATYSGNVLTFVGAIKMYHYGNGNHSTPTTDTVKEIWGVM